MDDQNQVISYRELSKWKEKFASVTSPGTLIFCLCENSAGSAAGYCACLQNHVVPLLLDAKIQLSFLIYLFHLYQPEYLYFPSRMKTVIQFSEILFEDCGYTLATLFPVHSCLHPDLAVLLTTSGSTGSPKLVRLSYKNVLVNARQIAKSLQLDETERPVTTLPMHYSYGLSIVNSHLLTRGTILLTNQSVMKTEFWEFMKRERATSFGGVPFTYELLKKKGFFHMDLPDLRYITQAGGRLDPDLQLEFAAWARDQKKRFFVMYGQTEATARMAILSAEKSLNKPGSIGSAIPGGKIYLCEENGKRILEPEKTGELIYEGANVSMGYASCAQDLRGDDEWYGRLATGDLARMDAEGDFYIVGRKKRFIKICGKRIDLAEVEVLIRKKYPMIDCAATGMFEELLVIVTRKGYQNMVREYLAKELEVNKNTIHLYYRKELIRNSAGKIQYAKMEEEYKRKWEQKRGRTIPGKSCGDFTGGKKWN